MQIYSLNSVPQITPFLSADAIILSKTDRCGVVLVRNRKERAMVKVKNKKAMLTILTFI